MKKNNLEQLSQLAFDAQKNSHSPYSNFKVGAALLTPSGETFSGCNVESAAFPLGQCAEATAIGNMVTQGQKRISHIVIASPNDEFCFPCGGCRQKIAEFAPDETPVTMVSQNGETFETTIGELLPNAFRAHDLDQEVIPKLLFVFEARASFTALTSFTKGAFSNGSTLWCVKCFGLAFGKIVVCIMFPLFSLNGGTDIKG